MLESATACSREAVVADGTLTIFSIVGQNLAWSLEPPQTQTCGQSRSRGRPPNPRRLFAPSASRFRRETFHLVSWITKIERGKSKMKECAHPTPHTDTRPGSSGRRLTSHEHRLHRSSRTFLRPGPTRILLCRWSLSLSFTALSQFFTGASGVIRQFFRLALGNCDTM